MDWKAYHKERSESNKKLMEDYPFLFEEGAPQAGLSHPKGWDEIVRDTSKSLTVLIKDGHAKIQVTQTKEKFGGLCFYIRITNCQEGYEDIIRSVIHKGEMSASYTCQQCGNRKGVRDSESGWMATLCQPCKDKEIESLNIIGEEDEV